MRLIPHNRVLIIALALGLVFSIAPASAKSPKPTLAQIEAAKKVEAAKKAAADAAAAVLAQANQTLQVLTAKSDAARAKYLRSLQDLAVARKIAKVAARNAQKTAAAVFQAHRVIGRLATNAYMLGGGLADIEPLLSSTGPQDLVDQLSNLNTLGTNNSTALDRYKVAEVAAREAQAQADAANLAQQKATIAVASAKKSADDAKAAQQAEVDKLQKVQDQLMKELASAKHVRITLEQQRQLALLEEAQARQAAQTPGQAKIWPDRGFRGRLTQRTSTAQQLKAVAFARAQVLARKPYVWGAQGPNSFDCSGLVYAAFRAAGLAWPNWDRLNAALYAGYVMHVSLSALQPGDLLFYSYKGTIATIHHISIYAGNGMMWEARSTKSGLRFSNMYSVSGLMPFGGRV